MKKKALNKKALNKKAPKKKAVKKKTPKKSPIKSGTAKSAKKSVKKLSEKSLNLCLDYVVEHPPAVDLQDGNDLLSIGRRTADGANVKFSVTVKPRTNLTLRYFGFQAYSINSLTGQTTRLLIKLENPDATSSWLYVCLSTSPDNTGPISATDEIVITVLTKKGKR